MSDQKHSRRTSLALPADSPRLVPAWNFRDDTTIMPERKGKVRKIADDKHDSFVVHKKQRKKWTEEETQMLVDGCNTVCPSHSTPLTPAHPCPVGRRQLEGHPKGPTAHV